MSDDDGMFLMNAASCGTCNQTGVVRTPEVMTRACPECVANGMPDPFKHAERQVAAVRTALVALEGASQATGYRMGENEAFTDGRREGYRLAVEHIRESLEVE